MDKNSIINTLNVQIQRVSMELANLKEMIKILRDNWK